jgi:hypothetical protein
VLVFAWSSCTVAPLVKFKREISSAAARADQLVVDFNVLPSGSPMEPQWKEMPTVTIGGTDKVREFVDLLSFKVPWLPGHCMCIGEMAFNLGQEGRMLKKLTLHHGESLRWCSLELSTLNFDLTAASRARLEQWLEQNAGEALRAAEAESEALQERWRSERERKAEAETQPAEK